MMYEKFIRKALILGALSFSALSAACGPKADAVKTADHIQPSPMPAGGTWRGVYYSPTYGYLHITEMNGAVQGAWRTTNGSKWGELYGQLEGDLLRFSWTEHKIGALGPNSITKGKGYFLYKVPNPKEAHELEGEWGLGDDEVGHNWDCVKQKNMEADPKSVRPNELESNVGAVGFDGKQAAPEAPSDDSEQEESADENDGI